MRIRTDSPYSCMHAPCAARLLVLLAVVPTRPLSSLVRLNNRKHGIDGGCDD